MWVGGDTYSLPGRAGLEQDAQHLGAWMAAIDLRVTWVSYRARELLGAAFRKQT